MSSPTPAICSLDHRLMPRHGRRIEAHLRVMINVTCKCSYRQNKLDISTLPAFCMDQPALFCLRICMGFTNGCWCENRVFFFLLDMTTKTFIDLDWIQVISWHVSRQMVCSKLSVTLAGCGDVTRQRIEHFRCALTRDTGKDWGELRRLSTLCFFVKDDMA